MFMDSGNCLFHAAKLSDISNLHNTARLNLYGPTYLDVFSMIGRVTLMNE
jgi:hypothetical protein